MEATCRVAGFKRAEFIQMQRYLMSLEPEQRKEFEKNWIEDWKQRSKVSVNLKVVFN